MPGRGYAQRPNTGGGHVQQTHPQGPPDRGPRRRRIREGRADRAAGLRATGAKVDVVSLRRGRIRGLNLNLPASRVRVDRTVEQTSAADYDGLLVPGGFINPDLLRQSAPARGLVREFVESGKPVVTLCHGPWVLASAGVLQDRTLTSWA